MPKHLALAVAAIAVGLAAVVPHRLDAGATPADVVYACPNGDVTYSHARHATKVPQCTECHPAPFGMAKSELGMQKGHEGCGKCHKAGGKAPSDVAAADMCVKCHKPAAK